MINKVGINSNLVLNSNSTQQKKIETDKSEKISRVEELKQSIKSGDYKIDLDKTSKALANSLL